MNLTFLCQTIQTKERVACFLSYYVFHFLAVWHQYDDAIFSSPSWFQRFRNIMPVLKSMDPVEGRNIATWAMLPQWEGFAVDEMNTSMTAWEAVGIVNDIAYCMTQTQVEKGGVYRWNVPLSYNFNTVSNYLC